MLEYQEVLPLDIKARFQAAFEVRELALLARAQIRQKPVSIPYLRLSYEAKSHWNLAPLLVKKTSMPDSGNRLGTLGLRRLRPCDNRSDCEKPNGENEEP